MSQYSPSCRTASMNSTKSTGLRPAEEEVVQRLDAIAGDDHRVEHVALLERAQRQRLVPRVVFDQQDDFVAAHAWGPLS
jgi:hypothetical protein